MAETIVRILMNDGCEDLFPKKNNPSDAGFDLCAAEDITLHYNEVKAVSAGFKMEMAEGWEAQIRSRSGNALKKGLTVKNGVGTIDCAYRGEVKCIMEYTGVEKIGQIETIGAGSNGYEHELKTPEPIQIKRGDKIAQMIFAEVHHVLLVPSKSLSETDRGEKGFGSSGLVGK